MRLTRSTAAVAAALIAGGTLSVVAGTASTATAACAPTTVVSPHATATKRVKVVRSTTVAKVRKKRYAATVRITARQGAATVAVAQTVCPDGAAGAAASTTQSARGVGTLTRTVSAKGATRAAAKRAARAKAQKAVARVRKAATTKRGLAAAKRRAIAAAQRVAVTKAHDALYRSTVVYVSTDSAGNFRVTASPTVAGTVRLTRGPGNDIVMTVPAQHDASTVSLPCLLRAPAWPTSYAFDATAVSPQARAMAASHSVGVAAVAVGPVAGATASNPPEVGPEWMAGWEPSSSGPTYWSGYTDDAPRFAGKMVCFGAMLPTDAAGITVTLRGARVGTTISAPDSDGLVDVVGGVPVAIR